MTATEKDYRDALRAISTLPTGSHQTADPDSYDAIRRAKQIAQDALAKGDGDAGQ